MDLFESASSNMVVLEIFLAIVIMLAGIVIGKAISYFITRISGKLNLQKRIRPSFLGLIITLVRWSIYIVFLSWAISQLPLPALTNIITNVLLIIPSIIAALTILVLGFVVAIYLREVVEEAEITGWKFLSMYLFYFVIFISGFYSLRVALFGAGPEIINYLAVIFSTIFAVSVGILIVLKNIKN